jgi:hypothetical protein
MVSWQANRPLPGLAKRSDIKFKGPAVPALMVQAPISLSNAVWAHQSVEGQIVWPNSGLPLTLPHKFSVNACINNQMCDMDILHVTRPTSWAAGS